MARARKLLRVLRAEREPRLTQAALAKQARLHRLRYWAIERGQFIATPLERLAIAHVLGVPVNSIAWPERPSAADPTTTAETSA